MASVDVRELRQNLSRYLDRVKDGESLDVTEHGRLVARLTPAGDAIPEGYRRAAELFGSTVPTVDLMDAIAALPKGRGGPEGTVDALLAEGRCERLGD